MGRTPTRSRLAGSLLWLLGRGLMRGLPGGLSESPRTCWY